MNPRQTELLSTQSKFRPVAEFARLRGLLGKLAPTDPLHKLWNHGTPGEWDPPRSEKLGADPRREDLQARVAAVEKAIVAHVTDAMNRTPKMRGAVCKAFLNRNFGDLISNSQVARATVVVMINVWDSDRGVVIKFPDGKMRAYREELMETALKELRKEILAYPKSKLNAHTSFGTEMK